MIDETGQNKNKKNHLPIVGKCTSHPQPYTFQTETRSVAIFEPLKHGSSMDAWS